MQEGVHVSCVVIVNGNDANSTVLRNLQADSRIQCIVEPAADKAQATLIARKLVQTEFFAYLDDDDELLPRGLEPGVRHLLEHGELACVATNGEYVTGNVVRPVFSDMEHVRKDFAHAVLRSRNWLAAGGAVFRSSAVGEEYFDALPPHREWTLIAFRIASRLKVAFLDVYTYRIHSTPYSQSKTCTYVEAGAEIPRLMLRWSRRWNHVLSIQQRENDAYRLACSYHRINGNSQRAWHFYRKAICSPFGISFVPYAALLIAKERRPVEDILAGLRKVFSAS